MAYLPPRSFEEQVEFALASAVHFIIARQASGTPRASISRLIDAEVAAEEDRRPHYAEALRRVRVERGL